jgi:hypothetical protein
MLVTLSALQTMKVTKLATNEKRKCKAAGAFSCIPNKPQANKRLKAFAPLEDALAKSEIRERSKTHAQRYSLNRIAKPMLKAAVFKLQLISKRKATPLSHFRATRDRLYNLSSKKQNAN